MDENSYYQNAMPSKLNSKIINQLDQTVRCVQLGWEDDKIFKMVMQIIELFFQYTLAICRIVWTGPPMHTNSNALPGPLLRR